MHFIQKIAVVSEPLIRDLKIVMLGASNVGKTTLVHRYIEKQYKETISTIGASFSLKNWNSFHIAIWDTAGEEKFRGLSSFYCRNAGGAILAFDITDEDSFHSLRALFIPLLKSALDGCVKIVVGTKLDLVAKLGRSVEREDGLELAREINSPEIKVPLYFETSSLTGEGVEAAFESLFQNCLSSAMLEKQEKCSIVDPSDPSKFSQCGC